MSTEWVQKPAEPTANAAEPGELAAGAEPGQGVANGKSHEEPLIRIRKLGVRFGRQPVLRDLDLDVYRGETLVVIGESGCGKTVLLKSIVALLPIQEGVVVFDRQPMHALGEKELTRQRLRFGFVFQQAALFDSLSVLENVAFAIREHTGREGPEVERLVRQRLAEVGLPGDILDKKPAELSGGMRKRVGLARAIILDPEVMLYDEPTTGLDPIMSDVINELILRTRERGLDTNVVVTHDMNSARKVATRIVMLHPLSRLAEGESQILYDGPPDRIEASTDPRVVQFVRGEARERLIELGNGVEESA